MATPDKSTSIVSSDSLEQKGKDMSHMAESNENLLQYPSQQQLCNSLNGPVAILWDIENCPVPCEVCPEDVAGNVIKALRVHPTIRGPVMMFSAYGDFNAFPRRLREGCQRTGVKLVDVPNGRKDAADKAILLDMVLFAWDNPIPSSIMLISGDVDFAPALHTLGRRGYTVILVIPARVGVSFALSSAGQFVWDWPSVACGEGCVPSSKAPVPPCVAPTEVAEYLMRCYIKDNLDGQNEEEAIVYGGISQNNHNSRVSPVVSQYLSEYISKLNMPFRSSIFPFGLNNVSAGPMSSSDQNECPSWVQPGDLNGLRSQLVKLIELSDGRLPLTRVQAEYRKHFGRPLCLSEYGADKLVNIFKKMGDTLAVEGRGHKKFVCLQNWKAGPTATPLNQAKNDKKGNGAQEENVDVTAGCHIKDNLDGQNEEEAIVYGGISQNYHDSWVSPVVSQSMSECNSTKLKIPLCSSTFPFGLNNVSAGPMSSSDQNECPSWVQPGDLNGLRSQLVKLIELSDGRLPLTRVQAKYRRHFGRPLYVSEYGADKLVNLFEKMGDTLAVEGRGHTKFVCLRNWKAGPSANPLNQATNDKKGKGVQEENVDITAGCSSGDTYM